MTFIRIETKGISVSQARTQTALQCISMLAWLSLSTSSVCMTASADELSAPMTEAPKAIPASPTTTLGMTSPVTDQTRLTLSAYSTDASGQWPVPRIVSESGSDYITLTLKTPRGQIRIDISIRLDDLSPEQSVDRLIDSVKTSIAVSAKPDISLLPAQVVGDFDSDQSVVSDDSNLSVPSAQAKRYVRDSVLAKLRRFVQTTGVDEVDRDELIWMMERWRPGPIWLIARDAVSPPKRLNAPLFNWLDHNRDGSLDESELQDAEKRVFQLDSDRNGILTKKELSAAINVDRVIQSDSAPGEDWILAWETDKVFSTDAGPNTTADRATANRVNESNQISNLKITADFVTPNLRTKSSPTVDQNLDATGAAKTDSKLSVVSTHQVGAAQVGIFTMTRFENQSVRIHISGYTDTSLGEVGRGQFSIAGTLSDRPIWKALDTDGDGRIVSAERGAIKLRLSELDTNQDKSLAISEIPFVYHLVVCQGNNATECLQHAIDKGTRGPNTPTVRAPDWFTGMDQNVDGALSRDEFLGSAKQFTAYDADQDGIITIAESVSKVKPEN